MESKEISLILIKYCIYHKTTQNIYTWYFSNGFTVNISCFTFQILFTKINTYYFAIKHILHVFHMCAIGFKHSTYFSMYTMNDNFSHNIFEKCFVKYCRVISPKWQHCCQKTLFAASYACWRIPTATMLTAVYVNSKRQPTHCQLCHCRALHHQERQVVGQHPRYLRVQYYESVGLHWREAFCASSDKIPRGSIRAAPHLGPWRQQYI